MDFQQARIFLEKFSAGLHTAGEHEDFIAWLQTAPMAEVQQLADTYAGIAGSRPRKTTVHADLARGIEAAIDQYETSRQPLVVRMKRPLRRWMAAAAIILLLASGSIVYLLSRSHNKIAPGTGEQAAAGSRHDLLPGGNKALLVLANGRTIVLDSAANGAIAQQENVVVNKQDGSLLYQGPAHAGNHAIAYNLVSTPRGGQFRVVLPDGSKVWLNAASSLRFPTVFSGAERSVELSGEAYFEVAHNPGMPFKVRKKDSDVEVQVLGTHFNVNAYDDEGTTKITLLEGSVKVSRLTSHISRTLLPGQQASAFAGADRSSDIIVDANADLEEVMAWKNGLFQFNNTNITAMMKQVSRWYDVDIVYEGNVMSEEFSGTIPRDINASGLFQVLELTKTVRFSIENKKIVVRPYKKS